MNIRMEDNVRMKDGHTFHVANVFEDHFVCKEGHKHMFIDVEAVNGSLVEAPAEEVEVEDVEPTPEPTPEKVEDVEPTPDPAKDERKKKSVRKYKEKKIGIDLDNDGKVDVEVDASIIEENTEDKE